MTTKLTWTRPFLFSHTHSISLGPNFLFLEGQSWVGLGPTPRPHCNSVTSLKTLFPGTVTFWGTGTRASSVNSGAGSVHSHPPPVLPVSHPSHGRAPSCHPNSPKSLNWFQRQLTAKMFKGDRTPLRSISQESPGSKLSMFSTVETKTGSDQPLGGKASLLWRGQGNRPRRRGAALWAVRPGSSLQSTEQF